ncbi:MAG: DUF4892 domain-containing protein [Pseudomonadales bacterium]
MSILVKRLTFLAATTLFMSLLFAPLGHAQADAADGEDLAFIKRFADSSIIRYRQIDLGGFSFPTGGVKKVDGRWQAERQQELQGRHTSVTYRIAERTLVDEVMTYFEQQLLRLNVQTLYRCDGFSCGNSNKWANIVFEEKRLYGPNPNQRYVVVQHGDALLSLYVIKRGNKRVYARFDYVEPNTNDASNELPSLSWVDALQRSGRAELDEAASLLATVESVTQLALLADWLGASKSTIYIVVHRFGNGSVSELISTSSAQASEFSGRLVSLGVAANQLKTLAVGPLAPGPSGDVNGITLFSLDGEGRIGR